MKMISITGASIALLMMASPSISMAAPNCNEGPYGSKCTRCYGWQNMSSWNSMACTLTSNPHGAGFPCSISKCGIGHVIATTRKKIPQASYVDPHSVVAHDKEPRARSH